MIAGEDDEMFMTRILNVTPKTTEQRITQWQISYAYTAPSFALASEPLRGRAREGEWASLCTGDQQCTGPNLWELRPRNWYPYIASVHFLDGDTPNQARHKSYRRRTDNGVGLESQNFDFYRPAQYCTMWRAVHWPRNCWTTTNYKKLKIK